MEEPPPLTMRALPDLETVSEADAPATLAFVPSMTTMPELLATLMVCPANVFCTPGETVIDELL